MERLCGLLQHGVDLALALKAVWRVTSIASSGLAEAEAQHVLGASALLIGHLGNSASPEIQCQAAWSIGNLLQIPISVALPSAVVARCRRSLLRLGLPRQC